MSTGKQPYVREMIREAVEALGGRTTNVAVRDWVLQKYPDTNPSTIQQQMLFCSVNHPSRIHAPHDKQPRRADDERYDFLFRTGWGELELYDPERHGVWAIEADAAGNLAVGREGEVPVIDLDPDDLVLDIELHDPAELENGRTPFIREMVWAAVDALGSPTRNRDICDWIEQRYPGTNRSSIQCHLAICCVNQLSRLQFPQNQRSRVADDPRYDFLYRVGRGVVEWYQPEKHGIWSIEEDTDGNFAICCDDGELIYPERREGTTAPREPTSPQARTVIPITQEQLDAAGRLHDILSTWPTTDRAFQMLNERFPDFGREATIIKCAVINDLYSTNVFAIWRMAEHIVGVMKDPPRDPDELAETIARLPDADGNSTRHHWSFTSKFCHFFVDAETFPIYDSYCRDMLAHHLGRGRCVSDSSNPYRAFKQNLEQLRELSGVSASLREMDQYLWLAGQHREWLKNGDDARINGELRGLFDDPPSPDARGDLAMLVGDA